MIPDSARQYRGWHGTSRFRARSILQNGFRKSGGRAGHGVYLWKDGAHAEYLAFSWHDYLLKRGAFEGEENVNCAILIVDFVASVVLDLEEPELKEQLAKLAIDRGLDPSANERKVTAFYDMFIEMLEQEHGGIQVVQIRVAPSRSATEYPIRLLGAPLSYVIRDISVICSIEEKI